MPGKRFVLVLVICLLGLGHNSYANCRDQNLSVDDFEKSTSLGLQLIDRLEALQPRVALVGRAGANLGKYGLKYSHAGLVFRNHPKGRWIFTHVLNHCATSESELFDEGVIPFFSDSPHRYEAILVIPEPHIQIELEKILLDLGARKLHESNYNVIANPFSDKYQNSNQWVLEMIAVAKSIFLPGGSRKNALYLAEAQGFEPDYVKVGLFKKLGASLTRSNVRFDDHSNKTNRSGHYPFVSVRAVVDYLQRNNDVLRIEELVIGEKHKTVYATPGTARSISHTQPPSPPVLTDKVQLNTNSSDFWQAPL